MSGSGPKLWARTLNANADAGKPAKNGRTPAFAAANNGHVDCLDALICAGADVNQANKYGQLDSRIVSDVTPQHGKGGILKNSGINQGCGLS